MTSLIYSTGAVSVSNGSAVVVGSLTGWQVALVKGGIMSVAGYAIPIASVEDDTHLTLAYPWPGVTGSGQAYAISRDSSEAVQAAWTNDRLATIIQRLSLVGVHPDGSGTIAQRNALSPVPATGFLWLRAEPDEPLEFYRKVASGWEGPFPVTGDTGDPGPIGAGLHPAGAWVIGETYNNGDYVSFGDRTFASLADGNVGNEPPSADVDDAFWMWTPAAVGPVGPASTVPGPSSTIEVGTVTGVAYGQPATVVDVGSPGAAVFDFEIPKGQDGTGTGDMLASDNLSDLTDKAAARTNLLVNDPFATKAAAENYAPAASPDFINIAGYTAAGDGGKALYKKVASEPAHAGKFSITLSGGVTVVWYEIAENVITPKMLGGSLQTAMDVAAAIKAGLFIGNKGVTYTISGALNVPDDLFVFSQLFGGTGAKIDASSGNYKALSLGQRVKLVGIEIQGPGNNAYNAASYGVFQTGTFNSGAAPTYVQGPDIQNCYIHGFRNTGIELRYVDGFSVTESKIDNSGYAGIACVSVKNGYVGRTLIDDVSPGSSANAYGMFFSRLAGTAVEDPPSKDVTVENCEARNVTIWHGFDTHGGIGIKFIDCITRNCKRGVFITGSNIGPDQALGPKRCLIQNFQYLDPNADYNLRENAIYVGGAINAAIVADYAEDCVVDGVYAFAAGIDQSGANGGAIQLSASKRTKLSRINLVEPVARGVQLIGNNLDFLIDGLSIVDVNSRNVNAIAIWIIGSNNTGRITNYSLVPDKNNQGTYNNSIGILSGSGLSNILITIITGRNMMTTKTSYGTAITAYDA